MLLALHMLALGVITVIFLGMIVLHRRARATQYPAQLAASLTSSGQPSARGPAIWLAVHSSDTRAVQDALGMDDATPCPWVDGLSGGHEFFIGSPVNGWTIVTGSALPRPGHDVDRCFHFLVRLSRMLGHVQFFMADPVESHHAWVRGDNGLVRRAYAWAGETVWNQGARSLAETELNMKCFGYAGSFPAPDRIAARNHATLNTRNVPLLAARWSINPAAVDQVLHRCADGFAGRSVSFHQD